MLEDFKKELSTLLTKYKVYIVAQSDKDEDDSSVKIGFQHGWEVEWTDRHHLGGFDLTSNKQPQTKRVCIDKDYCSSVVWYNKANWSEKDFNFTETELYVANLYSDAWEKAHEDYENVDEEWYNIAESFKFSLLKSLVMTKPEIEWAYWDRVKGEEVVYTGE